MVFIAGLVIRSDQNEESGAAAGNSHWVHPENTGNLTIENSWLYFAGGDDRWFMSVDVEVWGLH